MPSQSTTVFATLRRVSGVLCLGALLASGSAWAQAQPADTELRTLALQWLREAVANNPSANVNALRMEVSVGNLDNRLKLAPCGAVEAFLPVGSRLWGKTRVGLRCTDGMSRWNVTVPAIVKAYGNAWLIKGDVAAGAMLTPSDLVESNVDWAEDNTLVLKDSALWLGQVATRQLTTGQTLRQGMVKPAQAFQAGTQIRVIAQGAGFQVSGDAQALSAGVVGQIARVKMDNGRIASGTVLDARTVKIDL